MSAPAQKNFFEADRTITALTEASAAASSTAVENSSMNARS